MKYILFIISILVVNFLLITINNNQVFDTKKYDAINFTPIEEVTISPGSEIFLFTPSDKNGGDTTKESIIYINDSSKGTFIQLDKQYWNLNQSNELIVISNSDYTDMLCFNTQSKKEVECQNKEYKKYKSIGIGPDKQLRISDNGNYYYFENEPTIEDDDNIYFITSVLEFNYID